MIVTSQASIDVLIEFDVLQEHFLFIQILYRLFISCQL